MCNAELRQDESSKIDGGLSCICPCSRTLVSESGKVQLEVLLLLAARWWFLCRLVESQLRAESAAESSVHLHHISSSPFSEGELD